MHQQMRAYGNKSGRDVQSKKETRVRGRKSAPTALGLGATELARRVFAGPVPVDAGVLEEAAAGVLVPGVPGAGVRDGGVDDALLRDPCRRTDNEQETAAFHFVELRKVGLHTQKSK